MSQKLDSGTNRKLPKESTKRRNRENSDHASATVESSHSSANSVNRAANPTAPFSDKKAPEQNLSKFKGKQIDRPPNDYRARVGKPVKSVILSPDSSADPSKTLSPTARLKASAKEFTPPSTSTPFVGEANYESPMWTTDSINEDPSTTGEYSYEQLLQMQMAAMGMTSGTIDYNYSSYASAYDPTIQEFLYGNSGVTSVDGVWYPLDESSLANIPLDTTYYPLPTDPTSTTYPNEKQGVKVTTLESGYRVVTSKNGTTYFIDPKSSLPNSANMLVSGGAAPSDNINELTQHHAQYQIKRTIPI